jgi:Sec-independent protein secretion pathway component TatC
MIFLPAALILFVIGLFVKYKKVTWLISEYNTASKDKKSEYDVEKLTKYFGNFLFVLAGAFLF